MEVGPSSQEARVSAERALELFWKGCGHPALGPAPRCPQVQPLPLSDSITNHVVMVAQAALQRRPTQPTSGSGEKAVGLWIVA